MKVLEGALNMEKVLVGAFSGHSEIREGSLTALRHLVLAGAAELCAGVVADEGVEAVEVVR